MNRSITSYLSSGALAFGLTLAPAMAAYTNTHFTDGDLILYFQNPGSTNTVYADLGNAATVFRGAAAGPDATNKVNFLNINDVLTGAFGATWTTDTGLYAGVAGVYSSNSTSSALVNGDPYRTVYVSAARLGIGTVGAANSSAYNVGGNTTMTAAASGILAQNAVFANNYDAVAVVSPTSLSQIPTYNPFLAPGIQDLGFGAFDGGVQQVGTGTSLGSFGPAGNVTFALDLYRVLAKNTVSGQVAGDLRVGSYEGTVTINSSGQVSFISQGASSTTPKYDAWKLTFPALDTAAKQLAAAIPSNDGMTNLMKFVLNGNPSIPASAAITPQLNTSGTNFVFSFSRRQDSVAETAQVVQYGSDLAGWTDVTIPATGTGVAVGSATITVTSNGTTDSVAVTIPKSVTGTGKLFGRLKVTQ